jgi:hypothetical protein
VDDPGLTPHLGRSPAQLVRRLWKQYREDENPQRPAPAEEPAAPGQQTAGPGQPDQRHADRDHQVVELEDGLHRRPLVLLEVVQAPDHGVRVAVDEHAQQPRNLDPGHGLLVLVHPAQNGQIGLRARLVDALESGQLGRLVLGDHHGAGMSRGQLPQRSNHRHGEADAHRAAGEGVVPVAQQVVGADRDQEERAGLPGAHDRVRQPVQGRRVQHRAPETGDLRPWPGRRLDDVVGRGCLHPAVGHDDPDRAEVRSERDHDRREEVHARSHPVPAEKQDRQETRFEEEGEDPLRGEGTAEDVAHEA